MILAGDVGGTKTRLALFDISNQRKLSRKVVEKFDSKSATSLEEINIQFLDRYSARGEVAAACLGVPGPVVTGTVKLTNLPWVLQDSKIASEIGVKTVRLVNDLVAAISAIPTFRLEDLIVLNPGRTSREKNIFAVLAPGTGLDQSFMHRSADGDYHALPSEGGHVEFAPKNDLEVDLMKYMQKKLGHRVSVERVLCGPGLVNIYSFLRDLCHFHETPELKDEIEAGDAPEVISNSALAMRHEICVKALDIFASMLGSQAGDVVLSYLATGGIYLAGGIPAKIVEKLRDGTTVRAFLDKGRMSNIVASTPFYIIKDDIAALRGAANLALRVA